MKIFLMLLGGIFIILGGILDFYSVKKLNIFENRKRTVKIFLWNIHMDTSWGKGYVFFITFFIKVILIVSGAILVLEALHIH